MTTPGPHLWTPLLDSLPRSRRGRWLAVCGATVLGAAIAVLGSLGVPHAGELRVCGEAWPIDVPVLRFDQPGGYDAYHAQPRLVDAADLDGKPAYTTRSDDPKTLADLRKTVHLFVLHFDACGTSRQCFKVLQSRALSVHFLLDVDGMLYQTLDLKECAWHATIANNGSVGVEIAHPGCWSRRDAPDFSTWYARDAQGVRLQLPKWMTESGVRTPDFVARPSRPELLSGRVHDKLYWQYDYTDAQYQALAQLCAALHQALPRIRLDVPRNADGSVRTTQLTAEELEQFDGILGHSHVQANKVDPGPALDWERVLREAKRIAGE